MTMRKIDFVGIRTHCLDEMVALFRDIHGMQVARETDDLVRFR